MKKSYRFQKKIYFIEIFIKTVCLIQINIELAARCPLTVVDDMSVVLT